jgi:hypothetical protein
MQYRELPNQRNRCQPESIGLGRWLINGYKGWLQAQYYAEIPQRTWPMPLKGISSQDLPVARRMLLYDLEEPSLITLFTLRLLRKLKIARGLTKWSGISQAPTLYSTANAKSIDECDSSQLEMFLKNHIRTAVVSSRQS